jgi:hypothetical protein
VPHIKLHPMIAMARRTSSMSPPGKHAKHSHTHVPSPVKSAPNHNRFASTPINFDILLIVSKSISRYLMPPIAPSFKSGQALSPHKLSLLYLKTATALYGNKAAALKGRFSVELIKNSVLTSSLAPIVEASHYSVPILIPSIPAQSEPALPPDFVADEDLVQASSLPLSDDERAALIEVGMTLRPLPPAPVRAALKAMTESMSNAQCPPTAEAMLQWVRSIIAKKMPD